MKLSEIPTFYLRRHLKATEKVGGPNSVEVKILRRELARRDAKE